jgi:hypothetical protein
MSDDNPVLYDVARQVCHAHGLDWTDPRTGVTYPPPRDMVPGDIAIVHGLQYDTAMNGEYVEIRTALVENTVPEHDGVRRTALRYGCEVIRTNQTGYIRPEHLALTTLSWREVEVLVARLRES